MATLPASLDATAALRRRRIREAALSVGLWAVILVGWIYPLVALVLVPLCFASALAVAAFRSRRWCDWWCPRGVFLDAALARVSPRRDVPASLRRPAVRMGVLVLMMGLLVVGIAVTWGNAVAMGRVFVALLTATTVVGTVMGLASHKRAWCAVCPPGTMAGWIARGHHSPLGPDYDAPRGSEALPASGPKAASEAPAPTPAACPSCATEPDEPTRATEAPPGGCGGAGAKDGRRAELAEMPRVR